MVSRYTSRLLLQRLMRLWEGSSMEWIDNDQDDLSDDMIELMETLIRARAGKIKFDIYDCAAVLMEWDRLNGQENKRDQ